MKSFVRGACTRIHSREVTSVMRSITVTTRRPLFLFGGTGGLTRGLPDEMIARPPRMLGEIGWEINGGIVNRDVLLYQDHITELYFSGVIGNLRTRDHLNVLEIGAGNSANG